MALISIKKHHVIESDILIIQDFLCTFVQDKNLFNKMRLKIKKILCAAGTLLLLTSCGQELNTPLEGKWQLQKVETGGQVIAVDTIYYNFQNTLFNYQIYSPATDSYQEEFGFNTMPNDHTINIQLTDTPVAVDYFLPFTDWKKDTRSFTIDKVSSKQLILSADNKTYTFRKF